MSRPKAAMAMETKKKRDFDGEVFSTAGALVVVTV